MPLRVLMVKEETDVKSLSKTVLTTKLSAAQSEVAIASLAAANPHVDFEKVPAGTVLIIPDAPSFKANVGDPVHDDSFAAFEKIVKSGQTSIGDLLETAAAARREERANVTAAFKLAAVQRLAKADPALKEQMDAANAAMKASQEEDAETAKTFAAVQDGITDALETLRKVLG